MNVGLEYWMRGEDEQAIPAYKTTLELDPRFGYCYSYLGRVYARRGQCKEALELLRQGVDLTERGSEPWHIWDTRWRVVGIATAL